MSKIVFINAAILPKADRNSFIDQGFIVVEGNKVVQIGEGTWDIERAQDQDISFFDAQGKLIIPGLFNAHTHLAMTLLKGFGEDLPLIDWLHEYMFPIEGKWTSAEFVSIGTKLALLECIRSGVTAVGDMYYFGAQTAEALDQAGLRGWVGQSAMKNKVPDAAGLAEGLENVRKLSEKLQNNPRIRASIAPHSAYSDDMDTLKQVAEFAKAHNLIIQTHASESKGEQSIVAQNHNGMTPVEVFREAGMHECDVVLAHGVYLSDSDYKHLNTFNHVGLVYNPESNMKLGSGIADIHRWAKEGIHVAVGTDGSASNNDLDFFSEVRTGALLQKVNHFDPTVSSTEFMFHAATMGGAAAFRADHEIGSLEVGKKADLVCLDLSKPHLIPMHDALSNVIYCAKEGDVSDMMIDGQWVMRNNNIETLDEDAIREEALVLSKNIQTSPK